jgi:hypothetical protein
MAFSALITLSGAGADTGPFNLYSDTDSYAILFELDVPKADLLSGTYISNNVPDGTATIRVKSNSSCTNYVDMSFGAPTDYYRIFSPYGVFVGGDDITCSNTTPTVIIYLNATDYATFESNGNFLAIGMVLFSDRTGTVATYTKVIDPTVALYSVVTGVITSEIAPCV